MCWETVQCEHAHVSSLNYYMVLACIHHTLKSAIDYKSYCYNIIIKAENADMIPFVCLFYQQTWKYELIGNPYH